MRDNVQGISLVEVFAASRTPQFRSVMIDGMAEQCLRQIRLALFERMRNPVQLRPVQILKYTSVVSTLDDALADLPQVMLAAVVQVVPGNSRMLVIADGDLIGAVVDGMCGATTPGPFERDELSAMETRVGKQMIELTLRAVTKVASAIAVIRLTPVQFETATGMLAIADGADWMVVAKGMMETGTGSGAITLVCPYALFEPLDAWNGAQSVLGGPRPADDRWEHGLAGLAEHIMVTLRLEIARARVTIGVFEILRPGQILPCLLLADAVGVVGDVDLFAADYGQFDGFVCCRPKAADRNGGEGGMASEKTAILHDPENERVELERLQPLAPGAPAVSNKGKLERVPVVLSVELGRTNISVKDLRQLRQGQVIALDQMVGEPLGIFANGHRLAYGEVVAVGKELYGIRVISLADDHEHAKDTAA